MPDLDRILVAVNSLHAAAITLTEYAAAVSRAIRGAMQITGEAE